MAINFESKKNEYRLPIGIGNSDMSTINEWERKLNRAESNWSSQKGNYTNAEKYINEIQTDLSSALKYLQSASSLMSENYKLPSGKSKAQNNLDDILELYETMKDNFDNSYLPAVTTYKNGCASVLRVINDSLTELEEVKELVRIREEQQVNDDWNGW